MNLIPGNYTLTIDGSADAIGAYSFRLLNLAAATPVTPGVAFSGTLNPANETDAYRFDVVGGEELFFDVTANNNFASARWRLLDPYLNLVFERDFANTGSDVGPLTLTRPGTYTLLMEGRYFETTPSSYTVVLTPQGTGTVPLFPTGTPLTLNGTVSDTIGIAGEQDIYTFTLPGAASLYFDVLGPNDGNFVWSLLGPAGTVVGGRPFTSTDSHDIGNPVLSLIGGNYALTVAANSNVTGNYSFRLLNLADAIAITPGTPVDSTLNPGTETDLYRFQGTAGDLLYFDVTARSGGGNAQWSLIDSFGGTVFDTGFSGTTSDVGPFALPSTGNYTLMVEGSRFDGSASYSFNIVPVSNELNPAPLVFGGTVSEAIDEPGEIDTYTFNLSSASSLYFDMLSPNNGNFIWSLVGPAGTVIGGRPFTNTDSHDIGNPILNPVAGNYTLIIDGSGDTVGSYSFRLLNLADAVTITPGTPVDSTLNPGPETDLYRFQGTAGDLLYFDVTARSGGGNAQWSLINSFGGTVFDTGFSGTTSDVGPFALPSTGNYTLMIEGSRFDGSASYSFNIVPVSNELNPAPLVLGGTVSEAIDEPGEIDTYTFNLSSASSLYFDMLSPNNGNFNWSLGGPAGTIIGGRPFTNTDSHDIGNPILNLIAGNYTLIIDGSGDTVGSYAFRLLNLADAVTITPGTPVDSTLNPGPETDLYRFQGTAGDTLLRRDRTRRRRRQRAVVVDRFLRRHCFRYRFLRHDVGRRTVRAAIDRQLHVDD